MTEEAVRELEAVYADLGRELAERNPLCGLSGRCCRFASSGHQLWTTRLEVDYLLARERTPDSIPEGVCPYLEDGRCSVRDHRMLGCRVYFCDPAYAEAMGDVYERYHARVKEIHRRHDLPYVYAEFLGEMRRRAGS